MPQDECMERLMLNVHLRHTLVTEERPSKRLARAGHKQSHDVQSLRGIRAKMMQEKRHHEKIQMRKPFEGLEERNIKTADDSLPSDPVPHYLLDRNEPSATKALVSSIKQRRNEKAALFNITLPKVRGIFEDEMFKVVTTGKKTHQKSWKRIFTKPISFAKDSPGRTRSQRGSLDLLTHLPPMGIGRLTLPLYSRPMGLRQKFVHVNHLTSGVTLKAPIFSVKKNPQDPVCNRLL